MMTAPLQFPTQNGELKLKYTHTRTSLHDMGSVQLERMTLRSLWPETVEPQEMRWAQTLQWWPVSLLLPDNHKCLKKEKNTKTP